MFIKGRASRSWVRAGWAMLLAAGCVPLAAATIEEGGSEPPSPAAASAPRAGAVKAAPAENVPVGAKVRIGDGIGFYYFVRAGFVVSDGSKLSSLGRVIDSEDTSTYSTGKKAYVEIRSPRATVKPGDMLVVYRTADAVREPRSGFNGVWVKNLALVQVMEVHRNHCQVDIKESFDTFEAGDRIRPYDDEILRWKEAHMRKALPANPVHCYVAGGDPMADFYTQPDFIILTAGARKGVVEGQNFELRQTLDKGLFSGSLHPLRGRAQVFYVGQDYSMAQILESRDSIQKSFEADYRP